MKSFIMQHRKIESTCAILTEVLLGFGSVLFTGCCCCCCCRAATAAALCGWVTPSVPPPKGLQQDAVVVVVVVALADWESVDTGSAPPPLSATGRLNAIFISAPAKKGAGRRLAC